jgi:NhaP-type Na+/H+ or K+/H+ antiporter
MTFLLVFGLTLLVGVLISDLARRTVLSTSVLFLAVGIVLGGTNVLELRGDEDAVGLFVKVTLFVVLFTDGQRAAWHEVRRAWRLPARALLVGMPLTFGLITVLARYLGTLGWRNSALVAAALSPTDPVFASALLGQERVPVRVRRLLNVESGLNDGLGLPAVIVLVSLHGGRSSALVLLAEVIGGALLGVAVAFIAVKIGQLPALAATARYKPLFGFAILLVVLGLAELTKANEFIAGFAAGSTFASLDDGARDAFEPYGELVSEGLKLAALLAFGALASFDAFTTVPLLSYLVAALVLVAARPLALLVALAGTGLTRREWVAAAWFGPKGFASVVYALLILGSGRSGSVDAYHLIALVVVVSIVAHSSTDTLVARSFEREGRAADVPADTIGHDDEAAGAPPNGPLAAVLESGDRTDVADPEKRRGPGPSSATGQAEATGED